MLDALSLDDATLAQAMQVVADAKPVLIGLYQKTLAALEPIPIGARVKCLARSAGCRHWFEGEISARAGDAYQLRVSDHQRVPQPRLIRNMRPPRLGQVRNE